MPSAMKASMSWWRFMPTARAMPCSARRSAASITRIKKISSMPAAIVNRPSTMKMAVSCAPFSSAEAIRSALIGAHLQPRRTERVDRLLRHRVASVESVPDATGEGDGDEAHSSELRRRLVEQNGHRIETDEDALGILQRPSRDVPVLHNADDGYGARHGSDPDVEQRARLQVQFRCRGSVRDGLARLQRRDIERPTIGVRTSSSKPRTRCGSMAMMTICGSSGSPCRRGSRSKSAPGTE